VQDGSERRHRNRNAAPSAQIALDLMAYRSSRDSSKSGRQSHKGVCACTRSMPLRNMAAGIQPVIRRQKAGPAALHGSLPPNTVHINHVDSARSRRVFIRSTCCHRQTRVRLQVKSECAQRPLRRESLAKWEAVRLPQRLTRAYQRSAAQWHGAMRITRAQPCARAEPHA
jgi:hypothetical protein